jgi:anaerobic selenocysteine-containing dehydrogenase
MYMMGENPFMSDPNTNLVRKALSALDFLVVQDIFVTETAEFADVILPATSYLEKEGTYTNTDRGCSVVGPCWHRPARHGPTGGSPRRSPAGSGWTGPTPRRARCSTRWCR